MGRKRVWNEHGNGNKVDPSGGLRMVERRVERVEEGLREGERERKRMRGEIERTDWTILWRSIR